MDEVHVKSGDIVGFTKLNDSFPISYVFHPLQSVDIWYHNIDLTQDFPQIGDVIDFEEMGFPYRFSVTVRFWADIHHNNEENRLTGNQATKPQKDLSGKEKFKIGKDMRYVYNNLSDAEQKEFNWNSDDDDNGEIDQQHSFSSNASKHENISSSPQAASNATGDIYEAEENDKHHKFNQDSIVSSSPATSIHLLDSKSGAAASEAGSSGPETATVHAQIGGSPKTPQSSIHASSSTSSPSDSGLGAGTTTQASRTPTGVSSSGIPPTAATSQGARGTTQSSSTPTSAAKRQTSSQDGNSVNHQKSNEASSTVQTSTTRKSQPSLPSQKDSKTPVNSKL